MNKYAHKITRGNPRGFKISVFFKTVLNFWKLYQIISSRDFIFSRFDAKQTNRGLKEELNLENLV